VRVISQGDQLRSTLGHRAREHLTQEVGVRANQFDATIFLLDSNNRVARSCGFGYGRNLIEMFENLGLEGHSYAANR
jgi:hypothetical protein